LCFFSKLVHHHIFYLHVFAPDGSVAHTAIIQGYRTNGANWNRAKTSL
jgi:hypothetical protein